MLIMPWVAEVCADQSKAMSKDTPDKSTNNLFFRIGSTHPTNVAVAPNAPLQARRTLVDAGLPSTPAPAVACERWLDTVLGPVCLLNVALDVNQGDWLGILHVFHIV